MHKTKTHSEIYHSTIRPAPTRQPHRFLIMQFDARTYLKAAAVFDGPDPISDQFPHVHSYNYAELSPVTNIDLYGLQALNPNMAGGLMMLVTDDDEKIKAVENAQNSRNSGIILGAALLSPVDEVSVGIGIMSKFPNVSKFFDSLSKLGSRFKKILDFKDDIKVSPSLVKESSRVAKGRTTRGQSKLQQRSRDTEEFEGFKPTQENAEQIIDDILGSKDKSNTLDNKGRLIIRDNNTGRSIRFKNDKPEEFDTFLGQSKVLKN